MIPPNLLSQYHTIKFVHKTTYYQLFEAISNETNEICTIRVLDTSSDFYKRDSDLATTRFLQEMLHLLKINPNAVISKHIESSQNKLAFASLPYVPLKRQDDAAANLAKANELNLQQLIEDVTSDMRHLKSMKNGVERITLDLDKIFQMQSGDKRYFILDWPEALDLNAMEESGKCYAKLPDTTKPEMYSLGLSILGRYKPKKMLEEIAEIQDAKEHNCKFDRMIEELEIQKSSKRILKELLIRTADLSDKSFEELTTEKSKDSTFDPLETQCGLYNIMVSSKETIGLQRGDPHKIAFCSWKKNLVKVYDLTEPNETQLQGVQINQRGSKTRAFNFNIICLNCRLLLESCQRNSQHRMDCFINPFTRPAHC